MSFEILGKPGRALFELALAQAECRASEAVMLGDQLHTDIKGANLAGFSSCLVASGVTRLPLRPGLPAEETPTFTLASLRTH